MQIYPLFGNHIKSNAPISHLFESLCDLANIWQVTRIEEQLLNSWSKHPNTALSNKRKNPNGLTSTYHGACTPPQAGAEQIREPFFIDILLSMHSEKRVKSQSEPTLWKRWKTLTRGSVLCAKLTGIKLPSLQSWVFSLSDPIHIPQFHSLELIGICTAGLLWIHHLLGFLNAF